MKTKLVNENFKQDYLKNLLISRGITNIKEYIEPTVENLNDPINLDNCKGGAELLLENIRKNKKIAIVVDCDCDGYTSASIIWSYIYEISEGQLEADYYIHEGKQHGLSDCIDIFLEKDYDLIICPDSSSNDYEYHERLKENNTKILVLDHHLVNNKLFSDNAIIINNQLSDNYTNKDLTGAGVVFQFCRYLDRITNNNYAPKYIDLAALGICGDMGSIINLENRYIMFTGFNNIINDFFKSIIEKQSYSMNYNINSISVAFYIVPLINAMIRVGTLEEKANLFNAFIKPNEKIESKKRGAKGQLEFRKIESVRECVNAKAKQTRLLEKIETEIEAKIYKEDLLSNKILIIQLNDEEDFPSELNGLLAMRMASKFKKPTMVGRSNGKELKGSIRGLNDSELDDFRSFLLSSGLFGYVEGHAQASGYSIQNSKIDNLLTYANEKLKDFNFNEGVYCVNFQRLALSEDLEKLILELGGCQNYWGTNCMEPVIEVKDINLSKKDLKIIGNNKDTLKFEKNSITYVKFKAKKIIDQLNDYGENLKINLIGTANINEWGGNSIPQIIVNDLEIEEDLYGF